MTSPPTAHPHVVGVLARLTAELPGAVAVYDADVPGDPPQAYAVVYPDPGAVARGGLAAVSRDLTMLIQVTAVGTSGRQALDVASAVRAALVDHAPVVAGRSCWPMTQESSQPVRRDEENRDPVTNTSRWYAVQQFRLKSTDST